MEASMRLLALGSSLFATGSLGCTIVAVGREASSTGSPLVSHTDDSGPDTTDVRFVRVPRKRWPKGSTRKLYNWNDGYPRVVAPELSPEYAPVHDQQPSEVLAEIPQVEETYAYWDMDYGTMNEVGLSIGESTTTAKTVGWPATKDKPYGYNRAGIEDLSKIALERCETARCAVQLMGDLAVQLGFYSADSETPEAPGYSGSSEGLVVADTKDLWIFNVMTGANNASAIWAAQRVPPDHVVAVGNSFTIHKIDFEDHENFLYSPGITKLAEEMGWWSPKDGAFDFFAAYGYTPVPSISVSAETAAEQLEVLAFYSGRRMWRVFSLLSPEEGAKLDPNKGNLPITKDPYPGSVPAPKGSVSPQKVMSVLRDHYEGTPYDLTAGMAAGPFGNPNRGPAAAPGTVGIWERAISMHRTSWSFVLQPAPGHRGVVWLGLDSPHATAYLPFMAAATETAPEEFHSHEGRMGNFSTAAAWWAFDMIAQREDLNFQLINKDVREHSAAIEEEGQRLLEQCGAEADKVGSEEARKVMTKCTNEFATQKVAQWWKFGFSLFAKYGRYAIVHNETSKGEELQRYPAWWLNSVDVGFTLWSRLGPWHGLPVEAAPQGFGASQGFAASAANKFGSHGALVALALVGMFVSYKVGVRTQQRRTEEQDSFAYVAV